jgi:hypothetical protein
MVNYSVVRKREKKKKKHFAKNRTSKRDHSAGRQLRGARPGDGKQELVANMVDVFSQRLGPIGIDDAQATTAHSGKDRAGKPGLFGSETAVPPLRYLIDGRVHRGEKA